MMIRRAKTVARSAGQGRPAWVSIWAILGMTVLLGAMAIAVNAFWLGAVRDELRAAADAAALAGADVLVSDEWLRQGQPGIDDLLQTAANTAVDFAGRNAVLGQPVVLQLAPAAGMPDFLVGAFDATGAFVPATGPGSALTIDQASAVAVTARRIQSRGTAVPLLMGALILQPTIDLQAMVAAQLDRNVVGFQARTDQNIPLVPIGLRSDPTGADPLSWEYQVINRNGPDEFTFDPTQGFVAGPDGITEFDMTLALAPAGDPTTSNAYLLTIGSGTTTAQVTAGVSASDLSAQNKQLVLDANNEILVPGTALGPDMSSSDYAALTAGLEQLRQAGLQRIWPLVSSIDAGGTAHVTAFVAARIVRIQAPAGGPLQVRLQATMFSVPLALTDASRVGTAYLVPSPYVARVRLAR
jgi:hypothetical protein